MFVCALDWKDDVVVKVATDCFVTAGVCGKVCSYD